MRVVALGLLSGMLIAPSAACGTSAGADDAQAPPSSSHGSKDAQYVPHGDSTDGGAIHAVDGAAPAADAAIPTTPVNPTGPTYYVDIGNPAANDGHPGTQALPWKSMQKAAATLV